SRTCNASEVFLLVFGTANIMASLLLDRQRSLLDYLTSRAAIFGDRGDAPLTQFLAGTDLPLLKLEARFSHEKRMKKVIGVLPKPFGVGGRELTEVTRAFVEACPPTDISHLANARQFCGFLCTVLQVRKMPVPFLIDLARCELAVAEVNALIKTKSTK